MMSSNSVDAVHTVAEPHLKSCASPALPTILGSLLSANEADVRNVLMAAFVFRGFLATSRLKN